MAIFEDYDPELQTVISIAPPPPYPSRKAKSTFSKILDCIGSKLGFKMMLDPGDSCPDEAPDGVEDLVEWLKDVNQTSCCR